MREFAFYKFGVIVLYGLCSASIPSKAEQCEPWDPRTVREELVNISELVNRFPVMAEWQPISNHFHTYYGSVPTIREDYEKEGAYAQRLEDKATIEAVKRRLEEVLQPKVLPDVPGVWRFAFDPGTSAHTVEALSAGLMIGYATQSGEGVGLQVAIEAHLVSIDTVSKVQLGRIIIYGVQPIDSAEDALAVANDLLKLPRTEQVENLRSYLFYPAGPYTRPESEPLSAEEVRKRIRHAAEFQRRTITEEAINNEMAEAPLTHHFLTYDEDGKTESLIMAGKVKLAQGDEVHDTYALMWLPTDWEVNSGDTLLYYELIP